MKNDNTLVVVIAIILALFLFGGFGDMWGVMGMFNYGFGSMWFFGWIFMLLIIVVLVLLIVWLIKQIRISN
ncbi:hypothetical protein J4225_04845 [Candidatus Pacearchaeota archaeon]|nr:hypothetical protein [Candidatus Pacearchaeota archaeon]